MPGKPRVAWIDSDDVAEILDVQTAACSLCNQPARVPEDVLGIVPTDDHSDQLAVVVCPACTANISLDEMATLMARLIYEMREKQNRDIYAKRDDDD